FVLADIPGLIEGAHTGVGLGTEFLRHVERTRLLLHIVDASGLEGRDPVEDYHKINAELRLYSPELAERPQILVANKVDLPQAQGNLPRLEELAASQGLEFFVISAATGQGTGPLMRRAGQLLLELKKAEPLPEQVQELVLPKKVPAPLEEFTVTQVDGEFVVEGEGLERLMRRLDLNNREAVRYLQTVFEKIGLNKTLDEMGVPAGATVRVGELEFEYME
ncbi:MAG: Obg family GTPase CgtA, partial [Limnochordia bacterium]